VPKSVADERQFEQISSLYRTVSHCATPTCPHDQPSPLTVLNILRNECSGLAKAGSHLSELPSKTIAASLPSGQRRAQR
jgi:hypothetical protein